jgi:alpha-tubulin suppressor-like RCC1 family protein
MRYGLWCVLLVACKFPVPELASCDLDGACPEGQVCGAGNRCEPEPTTCAEQLTAGDEHTCVLRSDQSVWCWGRNTSGQLGDGTTDSGGAPVRVMTDRKLKAVAAGSSHTCAVADDTSVWCWGNNELGQLGGGMFDSAVPVQVTGLSSAAAVASGKSHSCALLQNGAVACWGQSGPGQYADGRRIADAKEIAAGGITTCVVGGDGTLSCWDRGTAEVLQLPPGVTGVAHVALGAEFLCITTLEGAVYCIGGTNEDGQLGRPGSPTDMFTPVMLPVPASAIVAGAVFACVLAEPREGDGGRNLWCWGEDADHQLADNTGVDHPTPFMTSYTGVAAAAGGIYHLCALSAAGGVTCSGFNGRGQLGNGHPTMQAKPAPAIDGLSGVTSIAAGENHTCAVAGGAVWCWGANDRGQLGDGSLFDRGAPVRVLGVDHATSVVANLEHTCALLEGGTAMCWGNNANNQLGTERPSDSHLQGQIAQPVVEGNGDVLSGIKQLATGGAHTCALGGGGGVVCWGANDSGQLGNGVEDGKNAPPSPVLLPPNTTALEITAGDSHSCALLMGGTVVCWGYNVFGQLGNDDSVMRLDRSTPVAVKMLAGAEHIRSYRHHTCATAGGQVRCWGEGDHGEIGNDDKSNRFMPDTPAHIVSAPTRIAVGGQHSCALAAGGLVCWGQNFSGQLGDGSFDLQTEPVLTAIAARGQVVDLVAGGNHTCALLDGGRVSCWGLGDRGQLADSAAESLGRVAPALTCP